MANVRALGRVLTDGQHAGAWPHPDRWPTLGRLTTFGLTFNIRALGRVLSDGQHAGAWPRPDRRQTCGRLAAFWPFTNMRALGRVLTGSPTRRFPMAESLGNPEPGFQSGPGDSANAD